MITDTAIRTAILLTLLASTLIGCRAMNTEDDNGVHYQNERRAFYAPEQEAKINHSSHAFKWASDELNGFCSQIEGSQIKADLPAFHYVNTEKRYAVDTLLLEAAVLFPTDKSELSTTGKERLSQVIERLQRYDDILHITVNGYADHRGSRKHNQELSLRRAQKVAQALSNLMLKNNISIKASGEIKPTDSSNSQQELTQNRRVSISAVIKSKAESVKPQHSAAIKTLCYTEASPPNTQDLIEASQLTQDRIQQSLEPITTSRPPLSAGDRVRITIPEGEELSGVYEVSMSGVLEIPFAGFVQAQGRDTKELEQDIHDRLIAEEIFRPGMLKVSTTVQEWAPVDILVSGATFDAGRVTINQQKADHRQFKQTQLSGDFARDRFLSTALRSAGGIRPDADLEKITLFRNGHVQTINLKGLFDGSLTTDVALAAGDQVVVPSTGFFQPELVRRSQITPPGIRIFISNLSTPSDNNAQAAINGNSTSIPYGTRFLQGLVSSNCVGGTQLTNASRRAILISRNPMTERTEVIERSIQQLVSDPQRDDINPFLMPNDGIACYDSGVTNFRDVTRTFFEFLSPILGLSGL